MFTITTFAAGFVCAAALAAYKPQVFRSVVKNVVAGIAWVRDKTIGEPAATDNDEDPK